MSALRVLRLRGPALIGALVLVACAPAGVSSVAPVAAAPAATPTPAPVVVPAAEEPLRPHADLPEIAATGKALRVLVRRTDVGVLPREGSAPEQNQVLLELLGARLGLPLRWVVVPEGQRLVDALLEGRGDLVGARHVEGAAPPGAAYTAALRTTREVVVCRAADTACPADAAGARKRTVSLPMRDGAPGSRLARWKTLGMKVTAIEAPRSADPLDLLQRLGAGDFDLGDAFEDEVETYLSYRRDVRIAFPVKDRIPVAWTVRADSPGLLEAANGLVYSQALTAHLGEPYAADLEEILARQVLRVAMLNNGASYYLYRGQEAGFQYDVAQLLARKLGVRLAVVVPEKPEDMVRLLVDNRVDLVPVAPGESGATAPGVVLSAPLLYADYMLVQPAGDPPVTDAAGLAGQEVHVRASSAYRPVLESWARTVRGLKIVAAPETLETPELIARVGLRRIPATVSNSFLLGVERRYRTDVKGSFVFATHQPLVYAARARSEKLLAFVNEAIVAPGAAPALKAIADRHFSDAIRPAGRVPPSPTAARLSPYDDLIRAAARRSGLDWRLVAAQMFHESRFDPQARSWAGAVGLLQLMPKTGAELGLTDLEDPAANVEAGTRYLAQMLSRFEAGLPVQQRVRFALASYNAGFDHVHDARALAKQNGWDPNRWFRNVERAMLLLENAKWYRTVRRGYCRGSEPVSYVSRIQTTYDAYARLVPTSGDTPATAKPRVKKKA